MNHIINENEPQSRAIAELCTRVSHENDTNNIYAQNFWKKKLILHLQNQHAVLDLRFRVDFANAKSTFFSEIWNPAESTIVKVKLPYGYLI